MLSTVASQLVEVHAQSANQSISKTAKQRDLVDRFAQLDLSLYLNCLNAYHEMKARIAALTKSIAQKESELADLVEFSNAFTNVKIRAGELTEIEAEISRLSSVQELGIATQDALSAISQDESGALTLLGNARRALEKSKEKDQSLEAIYQQVSEFIYRRT
jgi:DNA repair protein RecN (Recombination protein N)